MDYNEALMVEIATQGGGRFYHVQDAAQIAAYMAGELGEVADLAARDAKIELELPAGTVIPQSVRDQLAPILAADWLRCNDPANYPACFWAFPQ